MTTLNIPDDHDRAELAGRVFEAIDIEMAIRNDRFASLDEMADWLSEHSHLMNQAQRCDTWVMSRDTPGCPDCRATLEHARPRRRSAV